MTKHTVVFDFCGVRMRVTADARPWIDKLCQAFPPFVEPVPEAADFAVTISESTPPAVTHDLPLTWEGVQPDGFKGRIFETDRSAVLEVEDGGFVVIDHAERTATANFRPESYAQFFGTAVMLIVDAALAAGGQQLVHGACLLEKQCKRAVLICVPSGGGKTTTALALAHGGFSLMTDDASVLVPSALRPRVWGLPRALKVHRRTAELLPWVGPLPERWDEHGEQGVTLESLADRIEAAAPEPVELGAIMLLGPRSASGHQVVPLRKAEMLTAMAHDNVAWRPAGMVPKALRRFDVFANIVAKVPTFRISAGTELASLPALVAAVMNDPAVMAGRLT
jgi:hypothetical protein